MVGRIPSRRRGSPAPTPVIDLFAGPGGLGEGFSSLGDPTSPAFQIKLSAEMEPSAHKTLLLRAYYRALVRAGDKKLTQRYYDFCEGLCPDPWDEETLPFWKEAEAEALHLTLGEAGSDRKLYGRLDECGLAGVPWVLIGGPPCQAYSLVGRSRNRGTKSYKAEEDKRHYLYREYLKIIQRYAPAVFVMENVKGLLSSKVGDDLIFHAILRDLADPDVALGVRGKGIRYRIHSLVSSQYYEHDGDPRDIDSGEFVIRAEEHGIPQARHRVILVGVREGFATPSYLTRSGCKVSVGQVVDDLPSLRSSISRQSDSYEDWAKLLHQNAVDLSRLARRARRSEVADQLDTVASRVRLSRSTGGLRVPGYVSDHRAGHLGKWLRDDRLSVWLNHEARGHMQTDLRRYLYAAAFANAHERSPKGHSEFDLDGLAPTHNNWKSGKFADRFRVQVKGNPATTVTSHISKDGHYYIHPDPLQCRSLTVREAARLQTFPDNYFFQGNRTQQFVQVGNAVPPFLARQVAQVVAHILRPS